MSVTTGLRNAAFALMVCSFAAANHAKLRADECICELYEEYDGIGFFECHEDYICDQNKVPCANGFCGGVVFWDETYCGNSELMVTCNY